MIPRIRLLSVLLLFLAAPLFAASAEQKHKDDSPVVAAYDLALASAPKIAARLGIRNPQDVEDIVQNTMVKWMENQHRVDPQMASGWVLTVIRHEVISRLRTQGRVSIMPFGPVDDSEVFDPCEPTAADPTEQLIVRIDAADLRESLARWMLAHTRATCCARAVEQVCLYCVTGKRLRAGTQRAHVDCCGVSDSDLRHLEEDFDLFLVSNDDGHGTAVAFLRLERRTLFGEEDTLDDATLHHLADSVNELGGVSAILDSVREPERSTESRSIDEAIGHVLTSMSSSSVTTLWEALLKGASTNQRTSRVGYYLGCMHVNATRLKPDRAVTAIERWSVVVELADYRAMRNAILAAMGTGASRELTAMNIREAAYLSFVPHAGSTFERLQSVLTPAATRSIQEAIRGLPEAGVASTGPKVLAQLDTSMRLIREAAPLLLGE
jgi:DNA-directed RNA polymerase specialized sigma24 family protein